MSLIAGVIDRCRNGGDCDGLYHYCPPEGCRIIAPYITGEVEICDAIPYLVPLMALRLEEEEREDLERHVKQLENTLRAVAKETGSITLHGPCQQCGQCLLFRKRGTLYCPQCGEGQPL